MQCMQKIKKKQLVGLLNIIHVYVLIHISHNKLNKYTHVEIIYLHEICH